MFPCPHCSKMIEVGPVSKNIFGQYDPGPTRVSLGCGTLILIAVIVAMFSGRGDETKAIRALQREVQALQQKIDNIDVKPVVAPDLEESNQ